MDVVPTAADHTEQVQGISEVGGVILSEAKNLLVAGDRFFASLRMTGESDAFQQTYPCQALQSPWKKVVQPIADYAEQVSGKDGFHL